MLCGCLNSDMRVRFCLDCDHKRVSRYDTRNTKHDSVQQVITYIQDSRSAPSIKVKVGVRLRNKLFVIRPCYL